MQNDYFAEQAAVFFFKRSFLFHSYVLFKQNPMTWNPPQKKEYSADYVRRLRLWQKKSKVQTKPSEMK